MKITNHAHANFDGYFTDDELIKLQQLVLIDRWIIEWNMLHLGISFKYGEL